MKDHIRIHTAPAFVLDAAITRHPITGTTVELFQTFPQAQNPRAQRLVSLTLPDEAFARLGEVISYAGGQA